MDVQELASGTGVVSGMPGAADPHYGRYQVTGLLQVPVKRNVMRSDDVIAQLEDRQAGDVVPVDQPAVGGVVQRFEQDRDRDQIEATIAAPSGGQWLASRM